MLKGWSASGAFANRLQAELVGMRTRTVCTGKADPEALKVFQKRVDDALVEWGKVQRHNAALFSLTQGGERTAHIAHFLETWEGNREDVAALRKAHNDLIEARTQLGPTQFDTTHCNGLEGRRTKVEVAAENLCTTYETFKDTLPVSYLGARASDLLKRNLGLFLRAEAVPDATDRVVAFQEEIRLARKAADDLNKPGQERLENAEKAIRIAKELVTLGDQPVSRQSGSDVGSTVDQQAGHLAQRAKEIAVISRSDIDRGQRSEEAQQAISGASDEALAQLDDDAKLSLLESLLATDKLPKSSQDTKVDPLRMALRKLYGAMTLDLGFVKQDNALRGRAVDSLIKNHGKELQFYRDNWSVMTREQQEVALKQVLEAHCGAMELPQPKLIMSNAADSGSAGRYEPKTGELTICTSNSAFADFETVMEVMFHETTHHYQNMVSQRPDHSLNKQFPTQAKIFAANIRIDGAYVKGTEDLVNYKRQPIEAHAWMAGCHGASLLLQRLNALGK